MLSSSAFDLPRNWTSTLSRFGFGVLVLSVLSRLGLFPSGLDHSVFQTDNMTISLFAVFVLWIMLSMVVGGVATMIGSIGFGEHVAEIARVKRACRVGITQNPLLAEMLRDANIKFELSSGLMGTFAISIVASLIGIITGITDVQSVVLEGAYSARKAVWVAAIFYLAGTISSVFVRRSVTESMSAIDAVLDEYYPEQEAAECRKNSPL